jgi:hypothetical protein
MAGPEGGSGGPSAEEQKSSSAELLPKWPDPESGLDPDRPLEQELMSKDPANEPTAEEAAEAARRHAEATEREAARAAARAAVEAAGVTLRPAAPEPEPEAEMGRMRRAADRAGQAANKVADATSHGLRRGAAATARGAKQGAKVLGEEAVNVAGADRGDTPAR